MHAQSLRTLSTRVQLAFGSVVMLMDDHGIFGYTSPEYTMGGAQMQKRQYNMYVATEFQVLW